MPAAHHPHWPPCRSAAPTQSKRSRGFRCTRTGQRLAKAPVALRCWQLTASRRLALISMPTRLNRLRGRWPLLAHVTPIYPPRNTAAVVCAGPSSCGGASSGGEPVARAGQRQI
eukprot:COSAG06_NODE_426_length_15905_cov_35.386436_4_plen_114_part_00